MGEESWAASFSRLWMARSLVIVNDDTLRRESSPYIFENKCSYNLMPPELIDALSEGQRRSTRPTAIHRAYENKELAC